MGLREMFAGLFGKGVEGRKKKKGVDMNHVNRYEHQRYIKDLAGKTEAEMEALIADRTEAEKVIFRFQVKEFRRYGFLPYVAGGPGR